MTPTTSHERCNAEREMLERNMKEIEEVMVEIYLKLAAERTKSERMALVLKAVAAPEHWAADGRWDTASHPKDMAAHILSEVAQ